MFNTFFSSKIDLSIFLFNDVNHKYVYKGKLKKKSIVNIKIL